MKLTIERSLLLKALSHVQNIVERRQTIPALANVLMETNGDEVSLRATDTEIEVVEKVPANVETQGAVTVPARKFYDIVTKLAEGAQVQITTLDETGQISLVSGRAKFVLSSLPAQDFPSLMRENTPFSFTVAAPDLLDLLNKTGFSASMEEHRFNLNGVYIHEKQEAESKLMAVATDGHRLACASIPLPVEAKGMPNVIIPRKTISEISKLLAETEAEVTVSLSATQICFTFDDIVFSSRLIDGTYPEYEKVIPTGNDKKLQADTKTLSAVIERVSVVSERSNEIKLSLKPGLIHVSTAVSDDGSAEDELDAVYDSEPLEIGFNFQYLLDILAQIKSETVQIYLQDSNSPVILQAEAGSSAIYVLMPMRI